MADLVNNNISTSALVLPLPIAEDINSKSLYFSR
jgi:hypothetical protein